MLFFNSSPKPTPTKHVIYLIASLFLGILLSLFAHAAIEIWYLGWMESAGKNIVWYGGCALPLWLQSGLWLLGALGGFFLGRLWWRKIYIERVWLKKR